MLPRSLLFCLVAVVALAIAAAPLAADEPKFPTVEELDKLPAGLKVVHEPATVLATLTGKSERRGKYTWWFTTTVTAIDADVTIEQFGSFFLFDDKWVASTFTGKPFTPDQFAEWYSCENAKILKGKSATDPTDWASGNELAAGKARCYFIGVDAGGRRVKGEAIVELEGKIDPKRPKDEEPPATRQPGAE